MKNGKLKRILALFSAAVLTLSAMGIPAFAADPEEPAYETTDAYVINYANVDYGSYAAQKPYLYYSSHRGSMGIRNLSTGEMEYWNTGNKIYNLINTTKLAEGGTGAYASIPAYCTDACADAISGSGYRRINLENSTYFDSKTAGRLRAVFLHSFPYIRDMSVIENAVNAWLAQIQSDYTPLSGLTGAEAISATQYTIWVIANGNDVIGQTPYNQTADYTVEYLSENVVYPKDAYVDGTESARETTENNILTLHSYLMALKPQAPSQVAISDASISSPTMTAAQQPDGSYTVTVTTDVHATVTDADDLVLTAILGQQNTSVRLLPGQTRYTLTLTNVPAVDSVRLEINGQQQVSDVFLFDAGNRAISQSMIGYDGSILPVHAEATIEARSLTFYKTTLIQGEDGTETRIPLENIVFDIYRVSNLADFTSGKVSLPENPTAEYAAENYTLEATVTTGADGRAAYNLTAAGKEDGLLLVVERPHPAIVAPADPFYVCVPMPNETGDGWIYTVNAQPKNQVIPGPDIRKDVTEIENNEDTFHVGQLHTWIIRSDIPADIANGKQYLISDTLDYRLSFRGNLTVKVGLLTDAAGEETVTLLPNTDYVPTVDSAADADGNPVDCFTVSLTPAGMAKAAAAVGENDPADYEIRVYFDAVINSNAQMGQDIPNRAALDYTNSVGFDYDALSDIPFVYTGGVHILKYDAANPDQVLAGAQFKVARPATAEEIVNGTASKLVVGGNQISVVFLSFYTDEALTQLSDTVTTDEQGNAAVYGLALGNYYLLETKAPDGYSLLSEAVPMTISKTTHTTAESIQVANRSTILLPPTGGTGTVMFVLLGGLLIASAGAVFLSGKKKTS